MQIRSWMVSAACLAWLGCNDAGPSQGEDVDEATSALVRPIANPPLDVAAPLTIRENFETLRDGSYYAHWYYYPIVQSDVVCDTTYAAGAFSRAGCFQYFDQQSWSGFGTAKGGFIRSRGPWWIDPNHRVPIPAYNPAGLPNDNPGIGYINVLAFVVPRAAKYQSLDLTEAEVQFRIRVGEDFSPVLAPSRVGDRETHAYFWFQTAHRSLDASCQQNPATGENCTRQSDYILTDHELLDPQFHMDMRGRPGVWTDVKLSLPTDEAHWTCLGRGDNVKYDCMPIADALRDVEAVGFIMAPVCTAPSTTNAVQEYTCAPPGTDPDVTSVQGKIDIDDFALAPPTRAPVTWRAGGAVPNPKLWASRQAGVEELLGDSALLEFTASASNESRVIGLSARGRLASQDILFGVALQDDGRFAVLENGTLLGLSSEQDTFAPGDTFRVWATKSGSNLRLRYEHNGVAVRSSTLRCGTGKCASRFQPLALRSDLTAALERVVLVGPHRAMASDLAWHEVGAGITLTGDSIVQSGAASATAVSKVHLTTTGSRLDFDVASTRDVSSLAIVSGSDASCADHGLSFQAGRVFIRECGKLVPGPTRYYQSRDRFRIELTQNSAQQSVIRYLRDAGTGFQLLREAPITQAESKGIRASFARKGAGFENVSIQDGRIDAEWDPAAAVGVSFTSSSLSRPSGVGWDAGSKSIYQLPSGDGFVEFRTPDSLTGKVVGLGHDNTDAAYNDVEYQFWLPDLRWGADMAIYEYRDGAPVATPLTFGIYAAGDRFRVGVEEGHVTFRHNGELLYRMPDPVPESAYPLFVDASLFSTGAAIDEVTVSGNFVRAE